MTESESERLIERVLALAFRAMYDMGFFENPPAQVRWRIRWDGPVLSAKGLRAAATMEGEDLVMVLPDDFCLDDDIQPLIHECIHMAQMAKGDFVPGYGDGISTWKGREYVHLPSTHERYFEEQPWEGEARTLEAEVTRRMNELSNRP